MTHSVRNFAALLLCLISVRIGAQDSAEATMSPGREAEASLGATPPPGREVSLPPSEVKDTFFAYMLGIIQAGTEMDLDNQALGAILVELKTVLNIPFDLISRVSQLKDPQSEDRTVALEFQHDVVIPIPFTILFYHPGRITSAQLLSFKVVRMAWIDPSPTSESGEAFDLVLSQGSVLVEIDGWVKALFGLEDTSITHIVFFRWHYDWIGMLAGDGRSTGRVKRAYFDFTTNKILFPPPDSLSSSGKELVPDPSR